MTHRIGSRTLMDDHIRRLEREVTCSMCLSEFETPLLLPCLHVYCKGCIEGVRLQMTPDRYVCPAPQCHEEQQIPDLDSLPAYSIVNTKKHHIRILRQISEEHVNCQLCSAAKAVYVCVTCAEGQQIICEACSQPHKTRPELREHALDLLAAWLESQDSERLLRRVSMRPLKVCSRHGYQLRYYCVNCDASNCCECLSEHQTHDVRQVENAVEEAKGIIAQKLIHVSSVRKKFEKAASDVKETRERLRNQEEQREMDIDTIFKRVKMEMDSREETMRKHLKSMSKGKQNRLSVQLRQLESLANRAARLQECMDEVVQVPNLSQLMGLADFLVFKSNELEKRHEEVRDTPPLSPMRLYSSTPSLTPSESPDMAIQVPTAILQSALRNQSYVYSSMADTTRSTASGPGLKNPRALEMTYFKVYLRDASGQKCTQTYGLSVFIEYVHTHANEEVRLSPNRQGSVHVSYTPRAAVACKVNVHVNGKNITGSPFIVDIKPAMLLAQDIPQTLLSSMKAVDKPAHITISLTGTIYIVSQAGQISVLDKTGNTRGKYEGEKAKDPGGIAVAEDGCLFISSRHHNCISKYTPEGSLVAVKGKQGCKRGEFKSPSGICIKCSTGEVFVCDRNNHRVQVFRESDLQYLREFDTDLSPWLLPNLSKCSHPQDIAISDHGPLYITDPDNSCILVYSSDEVFQCSWGPEFASLSIALLAPQYIVMDSEGFIYVSDRDNQCITVLQCTGDPVIVLKNSLHLVHPGSIAVDNDGHVFVCDNRDSNSVVVLRDTPVKVLC